MSSPHWGVPPVADQAMTVRPEVSVRGGAHNSAVTVV